MNHTQNVQPTQLDQLMMMFADGEIITELYAKTTFGIKNLRARINELRQLGLSINRKKFFFGDTKKQKGDTGYFAVGRT